jgi:hypothetical protein
VDDFAQADIVHVRDIGYIQKNAGRADFDQVVNGTTKLLGTLIAKELALADENSDAVGFLRFDFH